MTLSIEYHGDAKTFLRAVGPKLEAKEERYGLLLGLTRRIARENADADGYVFASVHRDDAWVGAVLRTPGHKVLLSDLPHDLIAPLAASILERLESAPGVQGEIERAKSFANAWQRQRPVTPREGRAQRIYVCHEIVPPQMAPGTWRPATFDDRALLLRWCRSFMVDVDSQEPASVEAYVDRVLPTGSMILWVADGTPVSTAMTSRETPRGASVSLVYTPPEHRGRGYASNVTAALTQRIFDAGKTFATLYTDLGNATSNKIYQAIGYLPLADEIEIWFDPIAGPDPTDEGV